MKPFNIEDFEVGDFVYIDDPSYEVFGIYHFFKVAEKSENRIRLENPETFTTLYTDEKNGGNTNYHADCVLRKACEIEKILGCVALALMNRKALIFVDAIPTPTNSDDALWLLLSENIHALKANVNVNLAEGFHKIFRLAEVTSDGSTDRLIHTLLNDAPLFWYYFEQFNDKEI